MKDTIHKEKPVDWRPMTDEAISRANFDYATYPCPRCGTGVNFPLVATEHDAQRIDLLLGVIHKFLVDTGVNEMAIKELFEKIAEARRKKLVVIK